ncbi:D-arabinono-1,4-lactone oxidase [Protaetiibacter sp. SSC-01]|uniref:D-arabinono-1,4-lactone oxidase n=1 Tax=Protaetiibacter sp. SSC-01 TaxID=2759943 RepID=UPI00223BD6DD|nr:D-arabinono-1,4-lactone oxidase [Protaetiibacter sp. SSC-01]
MTATTEGRTTQAPLRASGAWRNWGRSEASRPAFRASPSTVAEVQAVVRTARERGMPVKTVGAGHSFTAIAATDGILVDLDRLQGVVTANSETGRVTLAAGTRLYQLPELLAPWGLALQNMGDIDRQSIAGATSTGTHGTGLAFGGLATTITGAVLVTGDGSILRVNERENAELLPAVRLGLGALGVLVELEIQCVPAYLLKAVEHPEPFEVIDEFRARVEAADHFELYWWPHTDRVMTKTNTRLPLDAGRAPVGGFANWIEEEVMSNGALAAMCNVGHLAPKITPSINRLATRVYGDREYTDYSYEVFTAPRRVRFREMEYALPLDEIPAALHELRAMIDASGWRISFPVEVRAAAPDENWLSTAHGRESGYIAVHRYLRDDPEEYFRAAEQIFLAHGGRPHWGKMHYLDASIFAERYPRFGDFLKVRDRLDPDRTFRNAYLDRVLGA